MGIEGRIKDYFAKDKDVLCVYLFGSAAKGKENKFSDVDVGVIFDGSVPRREYAEKVLSMMDGLSAIFDRDVDVVAMNAASSFLKFQIIKDGRRVYERTNRAEHSFEARAIVEYLDFLPVKRRLEDAMIRNIKGA